MHDDPGFEDFLKALGIDTPEELASMEEGFRHQLEDTAHEQLPTLGLRAACLSAYRLGVIGPTDHLPDYLLGMALAQLSSSCSLAQIARELRMRRERKDGGS